MKKKMTLPMPNITKRIAKKQIKDRIIFLNTPIHSIMNKVKNIAFRKGYRSKDKERALKLLVEYMSLDSFIELAEKRKKGK